MTCDCEETDSMRSKSKNKLEMHCLDSHCADLLRFPLINSNVRSGLQQPDASMTRRRWAMHATSHRFGRRVVGTRSVASHTVTAIQRAFIVPPNLPCWQPKACFGVSYLILRNSKHVLQPRDVKDTIERASVRHTNSTSDSRSSLLRHRCSPTRSRV